MYRKAEEGIDTAYPTSEREALMGVDGNCAKETYNPEGVLIV